MEIRKEELCEGFKRVSVANVDIFTFVNYIDVFGGFKRGNNKEFTFEFTTKYIGEELPKSMLAMEIDKNAKTVKTVVDDGYEVLANNLENYLLERIFTKLCQGEDPNYRDRPLRIIWQENLDSFKDDKSTYDKLLSTAVAINDVIYTHCSNKKEAMLTPDRILKVLFHILSINQLVVSIRPTDNIVIATIYTYNGTAHEVEVDLY